MTQRELTEDDRRNLHGAAYAAAFETHQDPARVARVIEQLSIPMGADILDVGCGNALSLEFLVGRGVGRYTGVDFSGELLNYARLRAERISVDVRPETRFFHGSVANTLASFGEGWVDLALALDVSEHVYDAEWLSACHDVYRMLKPGGRFIVHTPNASFFLERMKKRNFIVKQFPEHIAVRNQNDNVSILERAGFREIRARTIPHYNVLKYVHFLSEFPGLRGLFGARLLLEAVKSET